MDLPVMQALLGHEQVDTSARYIHEVSGIASGGYKLAGCLMKSSALAKIACRRKMLLATSKLDLVDFGRNPKAPQFGRFGMLNVRYGKAKKGQPPRRRNVLSVMDWAVEAVADYVDNVRPKFGFGDHPALWVTERGGRIKPVEINARFVAYRDALKLPKSLVPHSILHSYVTHLTEDGVDRRFIQSQVGHECDSSTAIYTHVSDAYMNTALRKALSPALTPFIP